MTTYSDPAAVIARTGVEPDDLGFTDDAGLETFLDGLLAEITDVVNRRVGRDWRDNDAGVPPGLDGIAADMGANAVRDMIVTRQSPTVRIDDFAIRTISSKMLTPDILERLKDYSSRTGNVALGFGDLIGTADDEDEWPIT